MAQATAPLLDFTESDRPPTNRDASLRAHFRTHAPQQITSIFDNLVGTVTVSVALAEWMAASRHFSLIQVCQRGAKARKVGLDPLACVMQNSVLCRNGQGGHDPARLHRQSPCLLNIANRNIRRDQHHVR